MRGRGRVRGWLRRVAACDARHGRRGLVRRFLQRGGALRRRSRARRVPQAAPSQLRRVRRGTPVPSRRCGVPGVVRYRRCCRRRHALRGRVGAGRAAGRAGRRWRAGCGQREQLTVPGGQAGRPRSRDGPPGRRCRSADRVRQPRRRTRRPSIRWRVIRRRRAGLGGSPVRVLHRDGRGVRRRAGPASNGPWRGHVRRGGGCARHSASTPIPHQQRAARRAARPPAQQKRPALGGAGARHGRLRPQDQVHRCGCRALRRRGLVVGGSSRR